MIQVIGYRITNETIESVIRQECINYEILILRNDVKSLSQGIYVTEKEVSYHGHLIREIYIRKKGKGNALNVEISYAKNSFICVIDTDCVLEEDALYNAVKHFQSDKVVAVGGRLIVKREDHSLLETIQFFEYTKIFQLSRRLFASLNAQCLISGAFGVFRKSTYWKSMDTISILLVKTFLVDFIYSQSITVSFPLFPL